MTAKIFSFALLITVTIMGFKQGYAMLSGSAPVMEMFGKLNVSKVSVRLLGCLTLLGTLMILSPQTYFTGNFLMAISILLILCLQLSTFNIKGAAIEIPFILMNLMLIYFQYPTIKVK